MSTPYPFNDRWPSDWQGSRVTGRFIDVLGNPIVGFVSFRPSVSAMTSVAKKTIILPTALKIQLDDGGAFDINLPATDDPDINPSGWTYTVTEEMTGGRTYSIDAPIGADRDLSTLIPVPRGTATAIVRGATGDSAYQAALLLGFDGTEQEWLSSLVGAPGTPGPAGVPGPRGLAGTNGTNGAPGPAGERGLPGTPGSNGTNGAAGAAGISAYQAAVSLGFTGTQAEWIASLKGERGLPGLNGTNGTNGTNGAPGTPGTNGIDGANGAPGSQGPPGVGVQGPSGSTDRFVSIAGASGVVTLDCVGSPTNFDVTLTGDVIGATIINPVPVGGALTLRLRQDAVGGRAFVLPASWRWTDKTAGTIATGPNEDTVLELLRQTEGYSVAISATKTGLALQSSYFYDFDQADGALPLTDWVPRPGTGAGSAVGVVGKRLRLTVGTSGTNDGSRVNWSRDPIYRRGWEIVGKGLLGLSSGTWLINSSYTVPPEPQNSHYEFRVTQGVMALNKRTSSFSTVTTVNRFTAAGTPFNFRFRVTETGSISITMWNVGTAEPAPQINVAAESSRAVIPAGVLSFQAFGSGASGGFGEFFDLAIFPLVV